MEKEKETFIIRKVLDYQSGTSKQTGQPWASQEFIVTKVEDTEYPDELLLRARGVERCLEWFGGQEPRFREGDKVCLGWSPRVSQWTTADGKKSGWRQENTCWRMEKAE